MEFAVTRLFLEQFHASLVHKLLQNGFAFLKSGGLLDLIAGGY